jgi:hypothetical protein
MMQTIYLTDDTTPTSPHSATTSEPGVEVRGRWGKRTLASAVATGAVAWIHRLYRGLQLLGLLCCLSGLALTLYISVFFERFQPPKQLHTHG